MSWQIFSSRCFALLKFGEVLFGSPHPFMIDLLQENTSEAAGPQEHAGAHCLVESSSPRARKEPALLLQGTPNHCSRCRTKYLCYIFCAHATASAPSSHLPITSCVPVRHNLKKETARKLQEIHKHYSKTWKSKI